MGMFRRANLGERLHLAIYLIAEIAKVQDYQNKF
jgi:hypothetical protein